MTLIVKHTKVSAIADNAQAAAAGEILPSDWNATHTLTGSADITINTSPIIGGTTGRVLYDNAGTIGEDAGLFWDASGKSLNIDNPAGRGRVTIYGTGDGTSSSSFQIGSDVTNNFTDYNFRQTTSDTVLSTWQDNIATLRNVQLWSLDATSSRFASNIVLGWSSTSNDCTSAADATLSRTGAGVLNLGGTAPQVFQVGGLNALFTLTNMSGANWFIGEAGNKTTTGNSNMGMGQTALGSLTSGNHNVAIGNAGLATATADPFNIAIGRSTLSIQNGSAGYNTAIGWSAGTNITIGNTDTLIGAAAGLNISSGSDNVCIGSFHFASVATGGTITTGSQNIVIGSGCDVSSASANGQLSIGNYIYGTGLTGTGSTISTGMIGIGTKSPATALDVNGTISVQSANGLFVVPNVSGNSWFIGEAGNLTVGGQENNAMGLNALHLVSTGHGNVGVGNATLFNVSTGSLNTAIGLAAAGAIIGSNENTAIGYNSLGMSQSDTLNVAIGSNALFNCNGSGSNTAIGSYALGGAAMTANGLHTAVGAAAGFSVTNGTGNTLLGYQAGYPTIVGASQCIVIGQNCDVSSASANGQMSIGNFLYGTGLTGTGSTISTGWLGVGKIAAFGSEALGVVGGITVSGDPGGSASSNTLSGANSTTISTGVGVIHMSTANPATNTGWLKCYVGTQVAWIPCWTTNAP